MYSITKTFDSSGGLRNSAFVAPENKLKVKFIKVHPNAIVPTKNPEDPDAVGYDLSAAEYTKISPFGVSLINTGIKIQIPKGYYAEIRPRSGMSWKNKTDVFAGIIDNSYLGVVQVVLANFNVLSYLDYLVIKLLNSFNLVRQNFKFKIPGELELTPGTKVAQLIFHKQEESEFEEVLSLEKTQRGERGFGSSDSK